MVESNCQSKGDCGKRQNHESDVDNEKATTMRIECRKKVTWLGFSHRFAGSNITCVMLAKEGEISLSRTLINCSIRMRDDQNLLLKFPNTCPRLWNWTLTFSRSIAYLNKGTMKAWSMIVNAMSVLMGAMKGRKGTWFPSIPKIHLI
jgi:hypothetical protein